MSSMINNLNSKRAILFDNGPIKFIKTSSSSICLSDIFHNLLMLPQFIKLIPMYEKCSNQIDQYLFSLLIIKCLKKAVATVTPVDLEI